MERLLGWFQRFSAQPNRLQVCLHSTLQKENEKNSK
jgi:hypothetical protein